MAFGDLPKKRNILLIITDREREVMHWPEGLAKANCLPAAASWNNGLQFTNPQGNAAACSASRAGLWCTLPSRQPIEVYAPPMGRCGAGWETDGYGRPRDERPGPHRKHSITFVMA